MRCAPPPPATGIPTGAVESIREPEQAEAILAQGQADRVVTVRMPMADPHWPLRAAQALGFPYEWPQPYLRANPG